jgi:ribosomal protein L22
LFFLFKSNTNKKGEEISNFLRILKVFSSTPLLQNSIQKRCCHFFQRKTKTKHQPI